MVVMLTVGLNPRNRRRDWARVLRIIVVHVMLVSIAMHSSLSLIDIIGCSNRAWRHYLQRWWRWTGHYPRKRRAREVGRIRVWQCATITSSFKYHPTKHTRPLAATIFTSAVHRLHGEDDDNDDDDGGGGGNGEHATFIAD